MEQELIKSEKMAFLGEMITNIAHQWRQPLSVITTGATISKVMNGSIKANNVTFTHNKNTYRGTEFKIKLPLV